MNLKNLKELIEKKIEENYKVIDNSDDQSVIKTAQNKIDFLMKIEYSLFD